MPRRPRLDPEIFHLPVERMREGYYSDKYFVRAREILVAHGCHPHVTMQVFGKQHAFLGGIDEAIAILKLCSWDWPALTVHPLYDGDAIQPWETVRALMRRRRDRALGDRAPHRGPLRRFSPPRNAVPGSAAPPHARRHQHPP